MSSIPLYQVDAFSDRPFKGNPAGVCLLPEPKPVDWMRNVATEMNLSETAFLVKNGADFDLRWFTPSTEVELCGHATLASAHILFETGTVAANETIRFHTLSGLLTATRQQDWIELNFPARKITPAAEIEGVTRAVGAVPAETYLSSEMLLYVYPDEAIVRSLTPDFSALARFDFHGLITTAPASDPAFDFVSRFFAPAIGINEDPVTGSAHCTLAPFWQERLHKNSMMAYQCSARGGTLKVRVNAKRVYICGQAVTVFATTLSG